VFCWDSLRMSKAYLKTRKEYLENRNFIVVSKVILKPSTREATFWHFRCIFLSLKSQYIEPIPSNPSPIANQLNSRHEGDMVSLAQFYLKGIHGWFQQIILIWVQTWDMHMLLRKTSNEWPGSKYRAKTKRMCSAGTP
jgi:hypothetical protein